MIVWYNTLTSLEQGFALVAIAATTFLILQTAMLIFGLGLHGLSDDGDFDGHDHDGLDAQVDIDGHDSFDAGFEPEEALLPEGADFAEATDIDADLDVVEAIDNHDFVLDDDGPDFSRTAASPGGAVEPSLRLFTLRGMVAFFALAGWSGLIALQSQWSLPAVLGAAFTAGAIGSYTVAKVLQVFLKLQNSGNVRLENAIGLEGEVYLRIPANLSGRGKITMLLQERFVELDAVTRNSKDLQPGSIVHIVNLQDEGTVIVKPKDEQ